MFLSASQLDDTAEIGGYDSEASCVAIVLWMVNESNHQDMGRKTKGKRDFERRKKKAKSQRVGAGIWDGAG